jgi:molybdenum cofactor cytidylyltransferase
MHLSQALRLSPSRLFQNPPLLGFVGAGGKTTALFQLARQLSLIEPSRREIIERPVVVTATTHMHVDQIRLADSHWIGNTPEDFSGLEKSLQKVMLVTGPVSGERTSGLNNPTVSWLRAICKSHEIPLLIEADGSRQHPLKAPAGHEPPIPDFVEAVVVVAGLSGLGQPLREDVVHRSEIFAGLSGLAAGDTITPAALLLVLTHPAGGMKNIPAQARHLVLLNQADTPELQSIGGKMAQSLLGAFDAVLVGSLKDSNLQTFEHTAGIILAAGEARRFGQPKQLLEFHGEPFVRAVARTALASGLSPVLVVCGAHAEAVEAAVRDLPVTITRNAGWQNGQSSSIKTGLQSLISPALPAGGNSLQHVPFLEGIATGRDSAGAAIFLLADQPQVTPTIITALTGEHARTLAPILAPLVAGRRANPVLFDRVTFPDLMNLTGDVGGRAVFSKYQVKYLPWQDESLLLDVDTPEDFERLRDQEL